MQTNFSTVNHRLRSLSSGIHHSRAMYMLSNDFMCTAEIFPSVAYFDISTITWFLLYFLLLIFSFWHLLLLTVSKILNMTHRRKCRLIHLCVVCCFVSFSRSISLSFSLLKSDVFFQLSHLRFRHCRWNVLRSILIEAIVVLYALHINV